jgi:hypothetical protein
VETGKTSWELGKQAGNWHLARMGRSCENDRLEGNHTLEIGRQTGTNEGAKIQAKLGEPEIAELNVIGQSKKLN